VPVRSRPASPETTSTPTVCTTAITSEFTSDRNIGTAGSWNRSLRLLHCSDDGKNFHEGEVISASGDNPLRMRR
jgi:hypothetical protein